MTAGLAALPPFPKMPTDRDLPYSDGEPMDSPWHRDCMNGLIHALEYHWLGRKDFFVGGDMFLYFSPRHVFNKDFRGPDFFVVKGVDHDKERHSYVAWEENSRLPCVIIELGSESTLKTDRGEKKRLYGDTLGTAEYFVYDPVEPRLEGWRLSNGDGYIDLEVEPGTRIWSKELELYVGIWNGRLWGKPGRWLRFFDVHGNLIPTRDEAAEAKADAADRRAAEEAAGRAAEEAARRAAEAEIERMKAELATLRGQLPPNTP